MRTTLPAIVPRVVSSEQTQRQRIEAYYAKHVEARFRGVARPYDNLGYWADHPASFEEAGFRLLEAIAQRAGVGPDDEVLDAGCGCGASSLDLAELWGCRRVVGIDVTEAMLAIGRRAAARRQLDARVAFRAMSATALDLPDASFSRAFAIDCADLFSPREAFFAEAFRVLRPGGVLALGDVVAGAAPTGPIQRALVRGIMRYFHVPVANYYGAEGYRARLLAAGFREVEIESVGDRVLPGAVAHSLSARYRAEYRAACGWYETAMNTLIFRMIGRAYRQRLGDYVFVIARK